MKKFILLILFLFFTVVPSVRAVDLGGEWVSDTGVGLKAIQDGDNYSLIAVEVYDQKYVGTAMLKGKITNSTFTGQYFGVSTDCPNLNGYVPAKGTISEKKIDITIDSFYYNPQTCTRTRPYSENHSFTQKVLPSPTPSPTPTPTPTQVENKKPDQASSQNVNDWIIENFGFSQPKVQEEAFPVSLLERTPKIKPNEFSNLSSQAKGTLFFPDLTLQGVQKPRVRDPETQQIIDLIRSEVVPGSTIFTGSDSMLIITPSGGVISLERNGETTILDIQRKTSDEKGPKNILVIIKGEVEVKTKDAPIDVETPDAVIKSKGTHYWVTYDPQKKSTTVGVYEGEVEVTPRGSNKSVIVSPSDGKPGLLGISQQFSINPVIIGLVLAVVIFWIIRKRRSLSKKKSR